MLYLKGRRIMMFQLSGFYFKGAEPGAFLCALDWFIFLWFY